MTFREPEGEMMNNYGPERDYAPPADPSIRVTPHRRSRSPPEGAKCLESLSCLSETFSRIKSWIFTLGKGYLYLIVGVLVIAILPLFMVSVKKVKC